MGERIKAVQSPTLTVNSAGTGFDEVTDVMWGWDSSTGAVYTPLIDGEILKIVFNFGAANTDDSATMTIATRDTPVENVFSDADMDWTADATHYVKVLAVDSATDALTNTGNIYTHYVVKGSLSIDCTGATDNDTVVIKIYYR